MADDYPILINGVMISARQHRECERIEHELRELEAEVAMIKGLRELQQMAVDEREHEERQRARRRWLAAHGR
jgi:hypothetical protein